MERQAGRVGMNAVWTSGDRAEQHSIRINQ
jgi:hypothetical protein